MNWAAIQPRRAGGLFATMSGAVALLIGFSAHDLATQSVAPARAGTHALLLVGLALAYAVDRCHRADTPGPGRMASRRPAPVPSGTGGLGQRQAPDRRADERVPRPASHHHAA